MKYKDILIYSCFVLSLIAVIIAVNISLPNYEYEIKTIILDNNNFGSYENVVDYFCTKDVKAHNYRLNRILTGEGYFYASTWNDNIKTKYGECAIKIKRKVD